ncbi:hypothetical protein VB773_01415 [Haloarculaceae archaeon H-GB2-1]|nr:hypothetical protein [Haloarculaceae archaeon H-GB1-1]MEA5406372.1 hypothetical protein [Haloarculaceae archaeon H-GB2-1]
MTIETNSKVERLNTVQDSNGNDDYPANEGRQKEIRDSVGNHDGLTAEEVTTGSTNPEQLPSHSVPDGVTVLVTYLPGNGSDVFVGDDTAQPIALTQTGDTATFEVTDTASIYVKSQTAGDGVGLVFEGGA